MAFPTNLDNLQAGIPSDALAPSTPTGSATYPHDDNHRAMAVAVEALEAKVGVGAAPASGAAVGSVLTITAAGVTGYSATSVLKGDLLINAADSTYGTTFDQVQINAAVVAAAAAGVGTVFVPKKAGPWSISRKVAGVQTGGGIAVLPGVNLASDGAVLNLADNATWIYAHSTLGTQYVITADTLTTDSVLTIGAGTAGLVVGADVLVKLATSTYDSGEPDWWLLAKVTAVGATSVTLDTPVGYAMSVAGTPQTGHRSVTIITSMMKDGQRIEGFELINPQTGGANAEAGISISGARNFVVADVVGEHVGAGLVTSQYVENLTIINPVVRKCDAQGGAASKGRCFNFAESRNVTLINPRGANFANDFIAAEAGSTVRVINPRIENTKSGRLFATPLFSVLGKGHLIVDGAEISGAAATMLAIDPTTEADARFRDTKYRTAGRCLTPLYRHDGNIRLENGQILNPPRRMTVTIALIANMVNVSITTLPNGYWRSVRAYVSDKTGITTLGINGNAAASELSVTNGAAGLLFNALTNGQTVNWVEAGNYGVQPDGLNDLTARQLYISTDGTVVTGSFLTLDIEYYPVASNDLAQGASSLYRGRIPILNPPAAIAAPTAPSAAYVQAEAQSMKTAVDAIRAALTSLGLTL